MMHSHYKKILCGLLCVLFLCISVHSVFAQSDAGVDNFWTHEATGQVYRWDFERRQYLPVTYDSRTGEYVPYSGRIRTYRGSDGVERYYNVFTGRDEIVSGGYGGGSERIDVWTYQGGVPQYSSGRVGVFGRSGFLGGRPPQNLQEVIFAIIDLVQLLIPLIIGLALLLFFWGLALFIQNAGNKEKIADGKRLMFWGTIALFVMVSIWGIIAFFANDLGIPLAIPQL